MWRTAAITIAILPALIAASGTGLARGIGCTELPEYYRAVGTVENGEGSCGMTMAEARRILARGNPEQAAEEPRAPRPRAHHKHRKKTPRQ